VQKLKILQLRGSNPNFARLQFFDGLNVANSLFVIAVWVLACCLLNQWLC